MTSQEAKNATLVRVKETYDDSWTNFIIGTGASTTRKHFAKGEILPISGWRPDFCMIDDFAVGNRNFDKFEVIQFHSSPVIPDKTMQGWNASSKPLEEYLETGDIIDSELLSYFINEVRPVTSDGDTIQMGEAFDIQEERRTYLTLAYVHGCWVYRGACFLKEKPADIRS